MAWQSGLKEFLKSHFHYHISLLRGRLLGTKVNTRPAYSGLWQCDKIKAFESPKHKTTPLARSVDSSTKLTVTSHY